MAAKMTTMFGDVTDLQQRHHPKNIPHFVEKMKGFPLKAKSFRNTATYERLKGKGGGGGFPLVPRWGMTLCVLSRPVSERI